MEFFDFFRQLLILLITISLYFPVSIPIAALAVKVQHGNKPLPLSPLALWLRATLAALGMAVLSISLMGFDKFIADAGLPPGIVHLIAFLAYIPLGAGWMFKAFALEDPWAGLSTLLLYVCMPGLVLVLLKLVFNLELPHVFEIKDWIDPIPV